MALDSYTCELCLLQRVETLRHLFLLCPFAKNCWASIGVLVPAWLRIDRATSYMKRHINQPFAMEIIIIMTWCSWKERNVWLFSGDAPNVMHCKASFLSEFALVTHRAKNQKAPLMKQWLVDHS
jgi:hypothetical protein